MARKRKHDLTIARAVELRAAGRKLAEIAAELSVSPSTISGWLLGAYVASPLRTPDAVAQHLSRELTLLDALQASFLPAALDGSEPAAKCVLEIMDRRAKYLGLYAPSQNETSLRLGFNAAEMQFKSADEIERDLRAAIAQRKADREACHAGGDGR